MTGSYYQGVGKDQGHILRARDIELCGGAQQRDGRHEAGDQGEGHGDRPHTPAGHQVLLGALLPSPPEENPDGSRNKKHGPKDGIVGNAEEGDELVLGEEVGADAVSYTHLTLPTKRIV